MLTAAAFLSTLSIVCALASIGCLMLARIV